MTASTEERVGQVFVYEDIEGVVKVCMIGYDVTQEEYDLLPEYLQEHFTRPEDSYNEVLLKGEPTVFILPDEEVGKIKAMMEEEEEKNAKQDS